MKTLKRTFIFGIITMVLTIIHHSYGAIIYEAPFRLHVALIAVPATLILLITFWMYNKQTRKAYKTAAFWIFISFLAIFPIGIIGLFEGVYNHVVKNILYFGGASNGLLTMLFPPPEYEMPNDVFFELTGILQAIPGLFALYYFLKIRFKNFLILEKVSKN